MPASNTDVPSLLNDDDDHDDEDVTKVGTSSPPAAISARSGVSPVPASAPAIPVIHRDDDGDGSVAACIDISGELSIGQELSAARERDRSGSFAPPSPIVAAYDDDEDDDDAVTRVGPQASEPPPWAVERSGVERSGVERSFAERSGVERSFAERSGVERSFEQRIEELERRLEEKSAALAPSLSLSPAPLVPVRSKPAPLAIAAAATLTAAAVLGTFFWWRSTERAAPTSVTVVSPVPTSETPSGAQVVPSSAVPRGTEMISVTIKASPASGRFRIDHGAWLGNPYTGWAPRDDEEHTIEFVADGYASRATKVRFAADMIVEVALERREPATVRFVPVSTPQAEPRREHHDPPPRPTPQGPKTRPLDPRDPWD